MQQRRVRRQRVVDGQDVGQGLPDDREFREVEFGDHFAFADDGGYRFAPEPRFGDCKYGLVGERRDDAVRVAAGHVGGCEHTQCASMSCDIGVEIAE